MVWPTVMVGVVVACGLAVAWIGYPAAYPHRLEVIGTGAWIRVIAAAALLAAAVWGAGRPLPGDHRAGILWARPGLYNNVRPWVHTVGVDAQPVTSRPPAERSLSESL
jgi:hypothetical protein